MTDVVTVSARGCRGFALVPTRLLTFEHARPFQNTGPLDAMFGQTGRVGDGTDWKSRRRGEHVETALVARRDCRQNDSRLTFEACREIASTEAVSSRSSLATWLRSNRGADVTRRVKRLTFRSTINQWLETLRHLWVDQIHQRSAHPPSGVNRIQATDDEVELHVIIVVLVLNLAVISGREKVHTQEWCQQLWCTCAAQPLGSGGTHGVTLTPGTRFMMNSAATIAFGCPTSFCL